VRASCESPGTRPRGTSSGSRVHAFPKPLDSAGKRKSRSPVSLARDRASLLATPGLPLLIGVGGFATRTPPRARPGSTEDRAKNALLWPDPSRNGRKLAENPGQRPSRHRRETRANKPNSGLASAWIAPRRSPVRVRLAPLGESLLWRGFSRFARGCESRPPLDRWPGLWPDLRAAQRPRRMRNRIIKRFRRYDRLSSGDEIELL
jgi:hypothetical protein